jgi:hypothetical protein
MISLQLWRPLQKPKDLGALDELFALTKAFFASNYSPPVASDRNQQTPDPPVVFDSGLRAA